MMSLRGAKRRSNPVKSVVAVFLVLTALIFAKNLWACPSGQTCPVAESDCISNPSLCVADTSSSDNGGTSTAPTTTDGQLGVTFDPEAPDYPWSDTPHTLNTLLGMAEFLMDIVQAATNFPSYQMDAGNADPPAPPTPSGGDGSDFHVL